MLDESALDRQIWNMLHGRLAHLAMVRDRAVRLDPRYGPFAAVRDRSPEALADLGDLIVECGQETWLVEPEQCPPPPGARLVTVKHVLQMVADRPQDAEYVPDPEIEVLTEANAAEMAEIARATEPGPWNELTHRYTHSVGIRREGGLAAMAGQRMLPAPDVAEVSGVCTWPEFRGQGMARRLIEHVMAGMRARGETPYLHSYSQNAGAIGLYTSLGFRARREMTVTVFSPA